MINDSELKALRKKFNDTTELFLTNSFKALGDMNRHRIFQILIDRPRLSAGDIAATLGISRPLASQHLKIMEQAKLFKKERVGQNKYYQLDRQNSLVKLFVSLINKS